MIKIKKDGQWIDIGGNGGGSGEPSEYLKNAEVIENATLRIEKKDGSLVDFTPTVSGGITRAEVETMVDTEKGEREAADTTLTANLTDEIKNRITGDDTLSQALTAETNSRTEADETLQTNIDNEASARQTADNGKVSIMEGAGLYANYVEGETTEQILEPYSSDVQDSAIVKRYGEQIKVPLTQTNDYEATSKAYVDSRTPAVINDTTASTTTTYSSSKINTLLSGTTNVQVVASKPESPSEKTMYYIGTTNPYTVELYVNGNWYAMGTTTIDLSGYFKTADIANNLTTTEEGKALDARQGKVLNSAIGTVSSQLSQWEKQLTTTTATANAAKAGLTNGSVTKVGTATVGGTLQPTYLNAGVPTAGTQLYNKNMTVNGTAYSHIRTANNNSFSIYAPTATGSQGQVLTSYGSGTPKWNSMFSSIKAESGGIETKGVHNFSESLKHFDMICFVYKLTDAGVYGCAYFPVFDFFTDSTRTWEISHGYDDDDHTIRFQVPNESCFNITSVDELSIRGIYGMFRCADKA